MEEVNYMILMVYYHLKENFVMEKEREKEKNIIAMENWNLKENI